MQIAVKGRVVVRDRLHQMTFSVIHPRMMNMWILLMLMIMTTRHPKENTQTRDPRLKNTLYEDMASTTIQRMVSSGRKRSHTRVVGSMRMTKVETVEIPMYSPQG